MARKEKGNMLVKPRMSADQLARVQLLRRSGASGSHGQGPRRERSRSARNRAAIRRAW